MNVLPLMQFIPAGSNYTAQGKTLIQQRHGLPLRAFVGFLLAYEDLNLTSQQTADRSRTPSSEDLGHPDGVSVETNGKVLFSIVLCICHKYAHALSRMVRVSRSMRVVNPEYLTDPWLEAQSNRPQDLWQEFSKGSSIGRVARGLSPDPVVSYGRNLGMGGFSTMLFDFKDIPGKECYKLLVSTVTPRPIAWVVSQDANGLLNAGAFSFFNAFSGDPSVVAIGMASYRPGRPKDSRVNIR